MHIAPHAARGRAQCSDHTGDSRHAPQPKGAATTKAATSTWLTTPGDEGHQRRESRGLGECAGGIRCQARQVATSTGNLASAGHFHWLPIVSVDPD